MVVKPRRYLFLFFRNRRFIASPPPFIYWCIRLHGTHDMYMTYSFTYPIVKRKEQNKCRNVWRWNIVQSRYSRISVILETLAFSLLTTFSFLFFFFFFSRLCSLSGIETMWAMLPNVAELKQMIMSFRMTELQSLLSKLPPLLLLLPLLHHRSIRIYTVSRQADITWSSEIARETKKRIQN